MTEKKHTNFKTRLLTKSTHDHQMVTEFWDFIFKGPYRTARDPEYSWQFFNPISTHTPSISVYTNEEHIEACLGFIPVQLKINQTLQQACFLSHWFAKPNGMTGSGAKPFLHIHSMFENILVNGYSKDTESIVKKIGYHTIEDLGRVLYINNKELFHQTFHTKPQVNTVSLVEKEPFIVKNYDKQLLTSWNRFSEHISFGTHRDEVYLNWRYFHHPSLDYIVISVASKYTGYAVIRVEDVLNSSLKILRVLDFITPETKEETKTLLECICCYANKHNVLFTDFFCSHDETLDTLEKYGWIKAYGKSAFKPPRLFQPMPHENASPIQCAFSLKDSIDHNDIKKAYITKSDGDQDRLAGLLS